ncbi:hypothetical protein Csa_005261 [Cucumis sativus]|uniref:Uncharacterized protein n=1 Tax=Cucumis sativus TaxID=3659 RepID=A0A0A0KCL5_CUCSA|nr:hypothetical protein Csa_005261 [Cucumis sativus]
MECVYYTTVLKNRRIQKVQRNILDNYIAKVGENLSCTTLFGGYKGRRKDMVVQVIVMSLVLWSWKIVTDRIEEGSAKFEEC